MRNIFNLTKIYFNQNITQLFRNKKKKISPWNVVFFILLFLVVSFFMGFAYWGLAEQFSETGKSYFVLVIGLIFSTFTVLLMNCNDGQNLYYKSKDYDILSSMPIKTYQIVTSKYLSSYMMSFMFNFTLTMPCFIVYFIKSPFNLLSIIFAMLSLFFLPSFTQLISAILSYLISLITSKMKNKNIINNILAVLSTVLITVFIILSNSGLIEKLFTNGIPLWIEVVLPHTVFLYKSIINVDALQFLYFILITSAFAGLSILTISLGYKKINTLHSTTSSNKGKLNYKKHNLFLTLLNKESKNFFNCATYFINCLTPSVLVIAGSITISLLGKGFISHNIIPKDLLVGLYIMIASLVLSMSPSTASSISIEGEIFLVNKSLPIPIYKRFFPKILFNILVQTPALIISNIIFACILQPSYDLIILLFILPILSVIVFSGIGLLINLRWAKLDWTSPSQAVKQSFSPFAVIFVAVITFLIPILLFYFLFFNISAVISTSVFLTIVLGYILILGFITYLTLFTHGKKLFNNIN